MFHGDGEDHFGDDQGGDGDGDGDGDAEAHYGLVRVAPKMILVIVKRSVNHIVEMM